ncbi:MAG: hypothetical protein DMD31_06190 [Gemmatimonadetes bacterium]|nr:MAG: hypothetical protein DMD31_06190 [Gemmatimonadota bacterium]
MPQTRGRRDWLHASFLPTGFTAASPAPRHASGSPGGIMRVAELMHSDLRTISADATVADAVTALAQSGVSAFPVLDRFGRAGVISQTDIVGAVATARV